MLEKTIEDGKKAQEILLMTHLVLGYPSFAENRESIEAMADAGVELIELQIPFSEPTADGPVILKANGRSIENGTRVSECFEFAEKVCEDFPKVSFLFMTYYNIVFAFGEKQFVKRSKEIGIKGFIIPDLPPEEAEDWLKECQNNSLDSVFIFTPTHSPERLKVISEVASGFVYCVGRRGVTGGKTAFDQSLSNQIKLYTEATNLPLALGFGVRDKADIDFLKGKVDIAVIGSRLIEIQQESDSRAIGDFLKTIRSI
ncbi:tryptophan synthase subunit alpha [bacterium]|nr:tryptophan synthase subunit alpha [bacterium]